jgi:hypothetical protein
MIADDFKGCRSHIHLLLLVQPFLGFNYLIRQYNKKIDKDKSIPDEEKEKHKSPKI